MTTMLLILALQQGAARGVDREGPEEFEILRTKTGITLPRQALDADLLFFLFSFDDVDDSGVDLEILGVQAEAAFGITEWLTAEVEIPCKKVDPDPGDSESGIGDIRLEGKFSFNRARHSPAPLVDVDLAAGARVTLPTGDEDEGLGEEHAVFGLFAAASHRFAPEFALHGEVFLDLQSEARPFHGVNAAVDFTPWGPDLSLLAALNVRREGTHDTEAELIPGVELRFAQPRLALGAGLPLGLTDDSPDWGLLVDAQLRF